MTEILAAQDVYKTYRLGRVDVPVLRGVSLSVARGEFVAIVGASGSGKSTLLHLLGGLDRPDARGGGVLFEDKRISDFTAKGIDRYRSQSVGFVFQFYHLLPELTVTQNVAIAAMIRLGRVGYMSQRAQVSQRAESLLAAVGLSHRLKHRPVELSGGERQRVAIARALMNDPPVLLADEPTGNLDHKSGEGILDAIVAGRKETGRTIVLVTHDREVAARADRIVRLLDGRLEGAA